MPMTGATETRLTRWLMLPAAILLAAALFHPADCAAQNYDEEQFIRGLSERKLDSAIEYLIANPPSSFDGRRTLLKALTEHYLPTRSGEQFTATYQRMQEMYQKLVAENAQRQPILASDYAQALMFGVLSGRQRADLFLAWGVPTENQAKLAEQIAGRCGDLLSEASETWTGLQISIPRSPNYNDLVNDGTWSDLQTYGSRNVPYFLAWARLYQAVLPGTDSKKANQLAEDGVGALDGVIAGYAAQIDGFKARCHMLKGRLLLAAGKPNAAQKQFEKVLSFDAKGVEPEVRWLAKLGEITVQRQLGKDAKADKLTEALLAEELTKQGLIYRILIYDNQVAAIRARMAKAANPQVKQKLLIASYKPYAKLLSDPAIPQDMRAGVEGFIFDRLTTGIDVTGDIAGLPPMVQLALSTNLYTDAMAMSGPAQKAKLLEAIKVLQPLSTNEQATEATRARAMHMLGASQFLSGQAGYAIQTMIALADQFPQQPQGELGIRAAVAWAESVYNGTKGNAAAHETAAKLYESALKILVEKYSTIDLAEDAGYMLGAFYRERERYPDAVKAYETLPADHKLGLDAQYEKLVCMNAIWSETKDPDLNTKIRNTVRDLQTATEKALQGRVTPQRRQQLRRYTALSELVRSSILIETSADYASLERALKELLQKYSDVEDLAMRVKVLQIRILQKQGEWAKAESELKALAQSQPDKAGPLAVGVIQNIFTDITQARIAKDEQRVQKLGQIALGLAEWVWDWVQKQPDFAEMSEDEKIAYRLMPANAALYAGEYEKARQRFADIRTLKTGRNNIEAVTGVMESSFQLGEQLEKQAEAAKDPAAKKKLESQALQLYRPASELCNQIIESETEKKTRYYWQAQARLMQMVDRTTAQKVKPSIAKGIQRMRRDDAKLGSEPWASILRQLEAKHSQR